ncbi:MAG TPA: DUF885 family protein, partial [Burkholderiaceae bacterium]|nr:DUF885 family protein [Burkholderiaceae bacterium]
MYQIKSRKIIQCLMFAFAGSMAAGTAFADTATDARYEALANGFIEKLLVTHPEAASAMGDHRYDSRSSDYSLHGVTVERALYHRTLDQLAAIPAKDLSADNAVDNAILQNELHSRLFDIEVMNVPAREPLYYNPSQGLYILLARDYAPLKQRLEAVNSRLQAIPTILAAARKNLKTPPRVFTETAIKQNQGAISLVKQELDDYLKDEPGMRAKLAPARKRAIAALTAYGQWLEHDLLPRSTGDFRIGKENFRQKLHFALDSDLTPEQILSGAESELKNTQQAMVETALPLYRQYFPDQPVEGVDGKIIVRKVLDKLAEARSDNDTIVGKAKQKLAEATDFVRAHK